ncbi:MAG: TIGR02281 family clan AA aspartic protease [Myxococcales bacterium]|nr:TIGR02281 family clan AA aspartic protease [Myxococcales bacterium]
MGVALLAVLGGGVGAVSWMGTRPRPPPPAPPAPPPPPKYGSFTAAVEQTRKLLELEPCDRKAVLKLSEALLKGDAPREAIGVVDGFVTKCGPYERLLWDKFTAHKRLSENDQAIAVATTLMESDPMDVDYPWWRGELLEAQGKVEEAVADYRLSLSLLPRAKSIPFMLTDALFKAGRPCEAIEPMNLFLHFHPDQRQSTAAETRLSKLAEAKCEMTTGEGRAVFHAPVGASAFRGQVKVNGKATGTFIIDTGASSVVLSRSFADKLGLDGSFRQVRVRTAGGVKVAKLTSLDAVEAQGAKSKRVEAVIIDDFGEDGLLGLSFLTRFEVQLDSKTRTLTLRARPKTP